MPRLDRATSTGETAFGLGPISADSYRQAKEALRDAIVRLGRSGRLRLPSEAELTSELGVSRATIRSVLQSLQKEGYIRRLHGQGTFINRHTIGIGPNLSEARPFVDLIAEAGMQPAARTIDQRVVVLHAELAVSLELSPGDEALRIERVFMADERPAVHSVDYVPVQLLGGEPEQRSPRQSTFEFVEVNVGLPVCYSVAEVRAALPPESVAKALETAPGQPMLCLRHTHVRSDELPVAVTVVHVNDAILRFSVVRTYLDQ